jgi:hypothetical protein
MLSFSLIKYDIELNELKYTGCVENARSSLKSTFLKSKERTKFMLTIVRKLVVVLDLLRVKFNT